MVDILMRRSHAGPGMLARLISGLKGPLGRGLGSNSYGQLVSLVVQFATVPLLLTVWKVERYGLWLTLATVPAYLSMSDFGFAMAAANDMSMAVARGGYRPC